MAPKIDYNNCITNLACSVQKYFDLPSQHNSLAWVDRILSDASPRNIIVILFDGMGANILERALSEDSFFRKKMRRKISTVFPATTTAATTSIRTGLNPVEHGWLGWNMYIAPIDETITLFRNTIKNDENVSRNFLKNKKLLDYTTIVDALNARHGDNFAAELFPFGDDAYRNLDDMISRIEQISATPGRHYIYAYDDEPDKSMHELGPDHPTTRALIAERSQKISELCSRLEDSIVVVVADHGHLLSRNRRLSDHPDLLKCMARTTSLEERAVSFKIKDGEKEKFRKLFELYYGEDFQLYDTDEVVSWGFFGDGAEHQLFREALGDYVALTNTDACLVAPDDEILTSNHAGCHEDEIIIPVIIS